jgi:hypothetical protein
MDWTKWQNKTAEMIAKYGGLVTIRVHANTGYSPASDDYTTKAQTDYNTRGIFTEINNEDKGVSLVQAGDRMLIVPALGLPSDLDKRDEVDVIAGGVTLNPIAIRPLSPGGEPIFYRIQVRG